MAHRLSTIRKANKILVMQDGHLVGEGTHEELLERSQVYQKMWAQYMASADKGEEVSHV